MKPSGVVRLIANQELLNLHLAANEKSADPASVAYDGVSSGMTKNFDRIIITTSNL